MRRNLRATAMTLAVTIACAAAAGCGVRHNVVGPRHTQRLDVVLDYLPNPDHVGIYAAQAEGYFSRVALDVQLRTPSDPAAPLKLLAAHKADLAISYEPEVLLARDRGLRVVAVGAIVQTPLTAIIALPNGGVSKPSDLAGKTVGTAGIPYQSAYLKTIEAGAHITGVKEVSVGFNLVPALLSHKVDATLGAYWNVEAIDLAKRGKHPTIIHIERAGVPTYNELVLVARQDDLPKQGEKVRRFVRAIGQGYTLARRDPARATAALVKANKGLDSKLSLAQVKASLPAFFPAAGHPFGYQDSDQWKAYVNWMQAGGLLRQPDRAQDASTNEFLAGQGL
ncbi:MAG TPA: ABC transporter substrate-binding protein [Solirubrobacteraceae bacterium]|nr:ABC transporter substrate-binding protein [Solirubrobacteraceae bacterium]